VPPRFLAHSVYTQHISNITLYAAGVGPRRRKRHDAWSAGLSHNDARFCSVTPHPLTDQHDMKWIPHCTAGSINKRTNENEDRTAVEIHWRQTVNFFCRAIKLYTNSDTFLVRLHGHWPMPRRHRFDIAKWTWARCQARRTNFPANYYVWGSVVISPSGMQRNPGRK